MVNAAAIGSSITAVLSTFAYYFFISDNAGPPPLAPEDVSFQLSDPAAGAAIWIDPTISRVHPITYENYSLLNETNWMIYIKGPVDDPMIEPSWESLAKSLFQESVDVRFTTIDATRYPGLATLFYVSEYPSFRYVRHGAVRYCFYHADHPLFMRDLEAFLKGGWQRTRAHFRLSSAWSDFAAIQLNLYNQFLEKGMSWNAFTIDLFLEHPLIAYSLFLFVLLFSYALYRVFNYVKKVKYA